MIAFLPDPVVPTAVGLLGVFGLTRFLRSLLFEVSPADWQTYGVVSIILAGVGLVACYIPARRAIQKDPRGALRDE